MDWMQTIEIVAACVGLLYVWLEMRASMWLWPVGVVLPLFYIYISWESQVVGNVLVNVYYVIASILGWIAWHRRRGEEAGAPQIRSAPQRAMVGVVGVTLLLVVIFTWLFREYMGSPFPVWDGIATSVSFVGMWLLAKEYIQTWWCWILSNAIYSTLYFVQEFYVTGGFFVLYTVVAVLGLLRWRKLMLAE